MNVYIKFLSSQMRRAAMLIPPRMGEPSRLTEEQQYMRKMESLGYGPKRPKNHWL